MIQASLYILFCSARNRLRVRFRRLREPRYLLGAIVGLAYFYFVFFARMRSQSSVMRRRGTNLPLATLATAGPTLSGLALMVAMAAAWILPFDNVLLQFSAAEIQFLFPAPVSRRSLLIHRLLRSQVRALFGAAIFGIAVPSLGGGYARLRTGIGMWLVMGTLRMYFTGVSLARTSLRSTDWRARRVAWLSIGVIAFAWAVVGAAFARAFAGSSIAGIPGIDLLWNRILLVATTGASRIAMAPFIAIAWPIFAPWPHPYGLAVLASAAVLAACIGWVILSDGALQVSTDAVTANLSPALAPAWSASATAAPSSTSQGVASPAYRAAAVGAAWRLAPTGRAESILVWKAATH
jgi:ABC-2 type transport system permease protein